jgi:hypothetical protein
MNWHIELVASKRLDEDKASDTQLIQELLAEGLHAVTRYLAPLSARARSR